MAELKEIGSNSQAEKSPNRLVKTSVTMDLEEVDPNQLRRKKEIIRRRNLLIMGFALTLPLFVINMLGMDWFSDTRWRDWILFILATPVWAVVGWEFHKVALKTARHFSANMATLISLGPTTAYLYSLWLLLFGNNYGAAGTRMSLGPTGGEAVTYLF